MVGYATSIYQVLLARLLVGLCLGLQQVAISVYLSETVDPKLRPLFGVMPAVAGPIGK